MSGSQTPTDDLDSFEVVTPADYAVITTVLTAGSIPLDTFTDVALNDLHQRVQNELAQRKRALDVEQICAGIVARGYHVEFQREHPLEISGLVSYNVVVPVELAAHRTDSTDPYRWFKNAWISEWHTDLTLLGRHIAAALPKLTRGTHNFTQTTSWVTTDHHYADGQALLTIWVRQMPMPRTTGFGIIADHHNYPDGMYITYTEMEPGVSYHGFTTDSTMPLYRVDPVAIVNAWLKSDSGVVMVDGVKWEYSWLLADSPAFDSLIPLPST